VTVKGLVATQDSPVSVLVRQSDLFPKEKVTGGVIAVINGKGDFFTFGENYWQSRADNLQKQGVRTLKKLRDLLAPRQLPRKSKKDPVVFGEPWSEASFVFHGNGTQALVNFGGARDPNAGQGFIDEDLLEDEMALGGPGAAATVSRADTRVVLRGCNIGRNAPLLSALKTFLRCGQVVAPRFLQTYFQMAGSGTAEGMTLRLFLYSQDAKPADLDLDRLAQELSTRYAPGSTFWNDVLAMCPHFDGLSGTGLTGAWKAAIQASETLLRGAKKARKKFPFATLASTVVGKNDLRQRMGFTLRRIQAAQRAHASSWSDIRDAVEAAAKSQWLGKTHPHATDADFDELEFLWEQPGSSGNRFDEVHLEFEMEMLDGGFRKIDCLKFADWHLVANALTSKATVAAMNNAVAAMQKNPSKPVDVAFSASDRERLDWFLTNRVKMDTTKIKRHLAVERGFQTGWGNTIRLTASTRFLHVELVRQMPDGGILPPESFATPFYGTT
jgi:hypothetical protein